MRLITSQPQKSSIGAPSTALQELRESPQRWLLMLLLVAGMTVCYAHRGALSVAAPVVMKDLRLSPSAMGVLLSAFFWTYALMQLPAGWLVDRIGVRRAYAAGYAVWTLAFILMAFAKTLTALIAIRMLLGIGQAVTLPASARAVANWFRDRERGTVTACYLTGARWGQALIGFLASYFLTLYAWKWFFLVGGMISFAWILPWLRLLGKWDRVSVLEPRSDCKKAPTKSLSFLEALVLIKQKSVLGIFLGFFAFDYAWFLYTTWLPGYLVMERHFTVKEMGIYSSVPFILMSGTTLLSGFASDRLITKGFSEARVRKLFVISGLLIACLVIPAGLTKSRMAAVYLVTISLGGLGIASPNTWTLTQCLCSKRIVGTVSAIQNLGGNAGGIIAPMLTGFVAIRTGSFALALSIAGSILGAGVLAYGFLISKRVETLQPIPGDIS